MAVTDMLAGRSTALVPVEAADQRPAQTEERRPEAKDDQEFQATVRQLVENARSLMDEWIVPETDKAWRYYNGEVDQSPMGLIGQDKDTGEQVFEGSRIVLTECRDQVQMLIPEIYRVLAGHEEAVAFQPNEPEDVKYVDQVNDYVRHLFWDRNNGEALIKDGLLEWCVKFCAYRIWREHTYKERVTEHAELDEIQLQTLMQSENVVIEDVRESPRSVPTPQILPTGQIYYVDQPATFYDVRCRYFEPYGRTRVALIPQDELIVDLEAQTMDEATVIGIDCERRAGELIAMGLDPELVSRMAGKGLRRANIATDIKRHRSGSQINFSRTHRDVKDKSLQWVRVVDARVLVDRDGDGMPEAWRVIALGEPLEIAYAEEDPGSDTIVVGSPFPRPHTLIGQGVVEFTIDLQEIGTSIVRRALDNYARTINPRPAVSGATEDTWDDLLSWFGGPINLGSNGKIDWLNVPFHGHDAMALLGYFDERRTMRTGISPAAMGMDPRALKGQTVEAAAGILAGPQSRVEGLAREFATRIQRPLFKALLQITQRFQDRADVIRLRNEFVSIDPRGWNPDMDVQVDVGLGTGSRIERIMVNQQILAKLELLFAAKSPLFDVKKYHQALSDMVVALGRKDPERYFLDPESDEYAQNAQRAQQEQQQALQQAAQMEAMVEQAKAEAKAAAEAQAEAMLEQMRAELERGNRAQELSLEGGQKAQLQQLQGAIDAKLLEMEQLWKARLLELEGAIEARLMKVKGEQDAKVAAARPKPTGSANANVRRQ